MHLLTCFRRPSLLRFLFLLLSCILPGHVCAQETPQPPSKEKEIYDQIKAFSLTGGSADANELVIKRDRVQMTFTGTFFFSAPVNELITGAVFIGDGKFAAEVPPSEFEKENVKRLLGGVTNIVESTFKTAVFRFTDDTARLISERPTPGATNDRAQKLATDLDARILKESGANLASRLTLSIVNGEKPGFFFANFDGGKRRCSYVLDYQTRIPVSNFNVNAGEKGLIFTYDSSTYDLEIWMAFYSLEDYQKRVVSYSDVNNLIDIKSYDMDLDLRDHKKHLKLKTQIATTFLQSDVRALNFQVGESLGEFERRRLKKQMRLKTVRSNDGELAGVWCLPNIDL